MAKQKKNEILEEQKRAREEFLKLKKIQSGELEAGPKYSEVAIVPKTRKEKIANFWFHHKITVIAVTFITIVLSVLISQCAGRTNYDFEVVYFTYNPVLDGQLNKVGDYFEKYASDMNDDGEVNVQIINCSFSDDQQNQQYRSVQLQKLQSLMVADEKAMLFITDAESITYFDKLSSMGGFFEDEPFLLTKKFYDATKTEEFGPLPEGLQLSCRTCEGTTLEKNEAAVKSFTEAQKILKKIKEN